MQRAGRLWHASRPGDGSLRRPEVAGHFRADVETARASVLADTLLIPERP